MSPPPAVLVVDDDRDVADLYTNYLNGDYDVWTVYNGTEALERLDDEPDVVLLDRRMPGLSGDEVLERIRERKLDCRVGMVTAVEPDFNIVDMQFDDYVVKPVTAADLQSLVESLLARKAYNEKIQEYFSVASKRAALMEEKPEADLEASEEYSRLEERAEQLEAELDDIRNGMSDDELTALLGDVGLDLEASSGKAGEAGTVDGR